MSDLFCSNTVSELKYNFNFWGISVIMWYNCKAYKIKTLTKTFLKLCSSLDIQSRLLVWLRLLTQKSAFSYYWGLECFRFVLHCCPHPFVYAFLQYIQKESSFSVFKSIFHLTCRLWYLDVMNFSEVTLSSYLLLIKTYLITLGNIGSTLSLLSHTFPWVFSNCTSPCSLARS